MDSSTRQAPAPPLYPSSAVASSGPVRRTSLQHDSDPAV